MVTRYSLSKMAAATLLVVLVVVPAAIAVTYTVGDAAGWDTNVDYTAWATGKTFRIGDTLEFRYGPTHSVDVVDKTGYDSCGSSSASEEHTGGDNKIDLKTVGIKYFMCPTPGHCANGMKLAVTVVAASSGTPPPLASPPPSPLPVSPPPPTPDSPASPLPPPATPDLPRSDGTHEANPGSTRPLSPPPPSPPLPSNDVSSGLMNNVMVGISMVLALQYVMCR